MRISVGVLVLIGLEEKGGEEGKKGFTGTGFTQSVRHRERERVRERER